MAPRTPRSELAAALARHRSGQIPEPHVAAAILHILSGAVVLALLPFVGSPRSPEAVGVVALVAITVGIAHLVFPWSELGQRATLWIIPESLALVVAFNLTYGDEVLYTTFFFVVWAWVGLAHPPGTAARFSPLLVIAYLLPVATPSITAADRSDIAASSIYVIPLCVAVAEIVAHVAQKLRESERRAGRSEARYASLMRHANEFVVVYDDRGRMQYVNAAFERMVGLTHEQMRERDTVVLVHPDDRERVTEWFRDPANDGGSIEYRVQNSSGDWRRIEVTMTDLRDDDAVRGTVLTGHDITDRHRAAHALSTVAYTDSLTGLANRAAFRRDLDEAQAEGSVALLFFDIDDFKTINDSLGHTVGDLLLVDVSRRLCAALPSIGLYRMGGDEFVLLVREEIDATTLRRHAERVLATLATPFYVDGHELRTSVSVGIAGDGDPTSAEELLRHADLAMYKAKRLGGGRSAFFDDELAEAARRRLAIERDLDEALARNELLLEFQPIVDLATSQIRGAEALVRWDHPKQGRLYPDAFIEIAENTGLMHALGDVVLDAALQACADWRRAGHEIGVSVNVAPSQLRMSFVASVAAALRRHDLAGELLRLEITESSLLDPDMSDVVLPALRELGVSISIDDFGTGYSSLSYLNRVRVDALKIDRSFLKSSTIDSGDSLVPIIVSMARHLGLPVVAEGVETPEQVEFLRDLGCDMAQGFYFGRPMPASDLRSLLEAKGAQGEEDGPANVVRLTR